jgi:uncharacterized Ntn-hydrolase superfamily protein
MTWSIIARDPASGLLGTAIASRFFAVGALCIGAEARVGAVCTQALVNPTFARRSLAMMGEGLRPADVCRFMVAGDDGADQRQLHMMDWQGRTAAHTGKACVEWCGHLHEPDVSVAGNMLAGPAVVTDTLDTFKTRTDLLIVERLLAAMAAGEAAGGDKRGKQSAALVVQGTEPYPRFSIRADDHPDPLAELRRLYEVGKERFIPFSACFPTPERPHGIIDRAYLETIIERDIGKPLGALGDISLP